MEKRNEGLGSGFRQLLERLCISSREIQVLNRFLMEASDSRSANSMSQAHCYAERQCEVRDQ